MLAAGLKGIEENYKLPEPVAENLFQLSPSEIISKGYKPLPSSLDEALNTMESSELVREALGDHIFEWFLVNKRAEWAEYSSQVTPWELERYLPSW